MNSLRSILLVDDNVHGMKARRRVLADLEFEVHTATSAEEAVKLLEDGGEFDVLVTDYRMGQMNGADLIAHVRQVSPKTKTVLLSALVEPWGMTAESTGADIVIMKSATETGQLTRVVQSFFPKRKPVASVKNTAKTNVVKNG